jgi:hypothetical protein
MNALLPFGQQMLQKHGEFFPYGGTMTTAGEITSEAAYDGTEQPPSQKLIEMMTQAFRQKAAAGQIRAAGICYDVRTIPPGQTEKTDAICASLEHQSGQFVDVYLPYKKGWFGKIQFGQIFAAKRNAQFFIQS